MNKYIKYFVLIILIIVESFTALVGDTPGVIIGLLGYEKFGYYLTENICQFFVTFTIAYFILDLKHRKDWFYALLGSIIMMILMYINDLYIQLDFLEYFLDNHGVIIARLDYVQRFFLTQCAFIHIYIILGQLRKHNLRINNQKTEEV